MGSLAFNKWYMAGLGKGKGRELCARTLGIATQMMLHGATLLIMCGVESRDFASPEPLEMLCRAE
jgi:hypothetical protein